MNLFNWGEIILSSGKKSKLKVDCDALSDGDIKTLAEMIRVLVGQPFGSVEGIPRGGMRLAEALEDFKTEGPHLIADDVWTTGGSMINAVMARMGPSRNFENQPKILGAVIFARGKLPSSGWVKAIWHLDESLWEI